MYEFCLPSRGQGPVVDRQAAWPCGWLIQSKADMNLGAGLGVAVREFQTVPWTMICL